MAVKVRWTPGGWRDLDVIDAIDLLSLFPRRGRVVPEFEVIRMREVFIAHYRLVYEFNEDNLLSILALIHGARDLKSIWKTRQ